MKVMVLGGDGFCGWPTALHLKAQGHDVLVVDDMRRRRIKPDSLTPIGTVEDRSSVIDYKNVDLTSPVGVAILLDSRRPDAIIHFAETRAAPYSMRSKRHKQWTVDNNVAVTHNVLSTMVDIGLDAHLVHLGTMGRYGYSEGETIPEGYYKDGTAPPFAPGSVYHMTKCFDALMFDFYAKNDGLRITDLHQGIVWGTQTDETRGELVNRFDYCGDWGTVLNRFLVQAVLGHPLTVYGTGGQTRAFIHIRDTVRCVELALENPPDRGDRPRIHNQMTECHRVMDLARIVSDITGADIQRLPNPRKEAPENDLHVEATNLREMGLQPTTLKESLLAEVMESVEPYIDRAEVSEIMPKARW